MIEILNKKISDLENINSLNKDSNENKIKILYEHNNSLNQKIKEYDSELKLA